MGLWSKILSVVSYAAGLYVAFFSGLLSFGVSLVRSLFTDATVAEVCTEYVVALALAITERMPSGYSQALDDAVELVTPLVGAAWTVVGLFCTPAFAVACMLVVLTTFWACLVIRFGLWVKSIVYPTGT